MGPGGIRPCKTTANLKLWKNSVDFKGTILDFSGAANIECVRVQYSLGAPAIYNLRIVGALARRPICAACASTAMPQTCTACRPANCWCKTSG
ncbi:hypothetical protein M5585_23625 [Serratia ureilytica]